jgi:hypothetical protein
VKEEIVFYIEGNSLNSLFPLRLALSYEKLCFIGIFGSSNGLSARPKLIDRLALDLGYRTQGIRTRLAQGIP